MSYKSKVYTNMLASLAEARILDEEKQRRLIDASYSDALKILADYGWGDGGEDDIDEIVSKETSKLIGFINENCASDTLKAVLLAQFLFNNAKSAYKDKLTGGVLAQAYYGGLPELSGIAEDNYAELPSELASVLISFDERREDGGLTSQEIDRGISAAMYAYLTRITKFSPRLKKFLQSEIDLLNLMTLLRCRRLGFDAKVLEGNLIIGGRIKTETITEALDYSDEAFAAFYGDSGYDEVFGDGAEGDFADIEVVIDNYLYSLTLAGKGNITSDAPLVNYFYKQLYEYKTAKMILICLKNNVSGEIKRRLRNIYE